MILIIYELSILLLLFLIYWNSFEEITLVRKLLFTVGNEYSGWMGLVTIIRHYQDVTDGLVMP